MDKKKIFVILGSIILALLALLILWFYRDQVVKETGFENGSFVVEEKKISESKSPLNIVISYPYIKGANEFNKKIKEKIDSEIENFKKIALENDDWMKKNNPEEYAAYPRTYELSISYQKAEPDKNTVSIILEIYLDTGGAHPNGYFYSLTYDIANNKEIKLSDIFSGEKDYLTRISNFSKNEIKKEALKDFDSVEGFWIDEGTSPAEDNFSVFLLDKTSITFYFPPYKIGPYVAGSFKVVMPRQ